MDSWKTQVQFRPEPGYFGCKSHCIAPILSAELDRWLAATVEGQRPEHHT